MKKKALNQIKQLDLHGIRHNDIRRLVENFVLLNETPLKIICGSSMKMQDLVIKVLKEHKFKYNAADFLTYNTITVNE